ncbi:MAG: S8 family peptidase [Saprospiraceae bacterium]|nr:S8 family peptidase [Saprospiraceae bacterium]
MIVIEYKFLKRIKSGFILAVTVLWLTGALLYPITSYGQQPSPVAPVSRFISVVVSNLPAFLIWAGQEGIPVEGTYTPAKIVVLAVNSDDFLKKIQQHPLVLYSSNADLQAVEEIPVPGHNLFANQIIASQTHYPQYDGHGTVISIREFPFYFSDVDLQNRLHPSPHAEGDTTVHASAMATLAGGAGNSDWAGRGAAPACHLLSSAFGALLPEEDYSQQGITVQNHSYGVVIENVYNTYAYAYDVSTLKNPKIVHVFSAGNKGLESASEGTYKNILEFSNLSGAMKMAKNVLTVGATDSVGKRVVFSSRGPAYDGRIKPDLVAFGQDGTSGAAALVSGAAAVIQQGLLEKTDSMPDAALVRALLLQSATDVDDIGPDFSCGFGKLNLQNAVRLIESEQWQAGRVGQHEVYEHKWLIPSNAVNVKLTLVWNDVQADPGAERALVNNLDLELVGPDGRVWRPWVLNSFPHRDSFLQPARRGIDSLNNVEQISVPDPLPGFWEIRVKGSRVQGEQTFYVAYDWEQEGRFEWIFPLRNNPVTAGKMAIVAWESNLFGQSSASLEWKPVFDSEWQLIDISVSPQQTHNWWPVPDTRTEAQLRMYISGVGPFLSDTFMISPEIQLKVAFNCADSIGLFWKSEGSNARYQLFGLGEKYMEPLFVTKDTFLILQKSAYPQTRFAVSMIGSNAGALGVRSAAPDIRYQGVDCYIRYFLADQTAERQVQLTLAVATDYGLSSIKLEKWRQGAFEPLEVFEPVNDLEMHHTDQAPFQGVNLYRATLETALGSTIHSDTLAVYFTGERDWLVFPNPLADNQSLNILFENAGEATFRLYDTNGNLVMEKELFDTWEQLPTDHLPSGVYFFEAATEGKKLWNGKLVRY